MKQIHIRELKMTSLFYFSESGYDYINEQCLLENPAEFTPNLMAELLSIFCDIESKADGIVKFYHFELMETFDSMLGHYWYLDISASFHNMKDIDEAFHYDAFDRIKSLFYSAEDYGNSILKKIYMGQEEEAGKAELLA